ncbi:MAG: YCF48-related protein [Bacteroidota bacterium]
MRFFSLIRSSVIWIALFLYVPASAQWKWMHPQPFGGFIYTMKSPDPRHMWMAGTGGTIVCTRDGGRSWETVILDSNRVIQSLCFTDSLHGWASASGGYVYRTTNGGRYWAQIKLPDNDPRDIFFTDTLNGWVGDYWTNKLYKTSDGGNRWDSVFTGVASGSSLIQFPDSQHGFVGGGAVYMARTYDGGSSWMSSVLNLPQTPGVMCFPDTLSGYMMLPSWDSKIRYTNNAGQTWTSRNMPFFTPYNLFFSDRNHGWVVGNSSAPIPVYNEGRIARTTDGGETYNNVFPLSNRSFMRAVTASDSMHAWAAGDGGMVFATSDGGVNWEMKSLSLGDPVMINDVFALKEEHRVWAVGQGGFMIKSVDDGRSWERVGCGSNLELKTVHFFDKDHGIIAGEASRLYSTTDGGNHWERIITGVLGNYTDLCFPTDRHGFLTAMQAILETKDGGNTWDTCIRLNLPNELTSISFSDSLHGWAVGNITTNIFYAQILKTSDGGKSWTEIEPGTADINSIFFSDSLHGWMCGGSDRLFRTSDGGLHWTGSNIKRYSNFYSIQFTDSLHGCVVGDGGLWPYFGGIAAFSDDGGKTWHRDDACVGTPLHSIFFTDSGFGYAAGEEGAVVRWGENPLGIGDLSKDGAENSKLHVFPNPAGDQITVEFDLESTSQVSLEILSSLGVQVSNMDLGHLSSGMHQESINICSYQPGIYILILRSNNRIQTGKIIRKN